MKLEKVDMLETTDEDGLKLLNPSSIAEEEWTFVTFLTRAGN